MRPKKNKHKSSINQPRFNSAIDFRPLASFTLMKVNEKERLADGGFELAYILMIEVDLSTK